MARLLLLLLGLLALPHPSVPQTGQRCGTTWGDADGKCGVECPHDSSEECPRGEDCFSELRDSAVVCNQPAHRSPPPPPPPPSSLAQRCGRDWNDANGKCGTPCPDNDSEECTVPGEDCFSELTTPGACAPGRVAASDGCTTAMRVACEGQEHDVCDVCVGMDRTLTPVLPPVECRDKATRPAMSLYCQPVQCQWWQHRRFSPNQVEQAYQHFSYAGACVTANRPNNCPGGTIIPGSTMNNQLPQSQPICESAGADCCILTFPNEPLEALTGTTLRKPIVKQPRCAVMDTDGLRPPYVNFDDDHRDETSLPGLDA